ncbi:hypothetical protein H0O00_05665 [Candidatus Micrarchaeota archaeon]|nr:hypothetical protein [Candidatus Micrarchaeota archaeon]
MKEELEKDLDKMGIKDPETRKEVVEEAARKLKDKGYGDEVVDIVIAQVVLASQNAQLSPAMDIGAVIDLRETVRTPEYQREMKRAEMTELCANMIIMESAAANKPEVDLASAGINPRKDPRIQEAYQSHKEEEKRIAYRDSGFHKVQEAGKETATTIRPRNPLDLTTHDGRLQLAYLIAYRKTVEERARELRPS